MNVDGAVVSMLSYSKKVLDSSLQVDWGNAVESLHVLPMHGGVFFRVLWFPPKTCKLDQLGYC